MGKWWDEPWTAEEFAAQPKRRPFSELLAEYAERTGQKVIPVERVPPSTVNKERLDRNTVRRIRSAYWDENLSVDDIVRELRADGIHTTPSSVYSAASQRNYRNSRAS